MGLYDSTIGSLLIASWLACMVEAVIINNAYQYFTHYKNDHILLKLLVGFTMVVESLGISSNLILLYMTCVTYWGNPYILTYQVLALYLILCQRPSGLDLSSVDRLGQFSSA
ncbi:hypothetical protein PM082_020737 [Marasmius tenuissimus]|nr:hypothetical protein PM082_020737 [Marasmius tenuissimus]